MFHDCGTMSGMIKGELLHQHPRWHMLSLIKMITRALHLIPLWQFPQHKTFNHLTSFVCPPLEMFLDVRLNISAQA